MKSNKPSHLNPNDIGDLFVEKLDERGLKTRDDRQHQTSTTSNLKSYAIGDCSAVVVGRMTLVVALIFDTQLRERECALARFLMHSIAVELESKRQTIFCPRVAANYRIIMSMMERRVSISRRRWIAGSFAIELTRF